METERKPEDPRRLSAVRRDLESVNEKLDIVNAKIETLNLGMYTVPVKLDTMEYNMNIKAQKLADLDERNAIHSAKLRLLEKEIGYIKTENDILLEQMRSGRVDNIKGSGHFSTRESGLNNENMPNTPSKPQLQPAHAPLHESQSKRDMSPSPVKAQVGTPRKGEQGPYEHRKQNGPNNYGQNQNAAKHVNTDKNKEFDFEEYQRERRRQVYSFYDSTAINPQDWEKKPKHKKYPWYDHETIPYPGGLLLMRFEDSGYDTVNVALKSQQSICRHAGGYLMGIARKDRIFVYESVPSKQQNWYVSRNQPYKDVVMTENALAVFWFTKKEAAEGFFENCHHNRFREPCFPTPNGFEAFYVPLLQPPTKPLNTFFCIEFLDAKKYNPEDLTQFEVEVRDDMQRVIPGCLPMVISSQTGRVIFKPGVLISPYSKLFVSRFESQRDVDQIWRLGMIQALRHKWNLTGPINVFSFTIDIAF